LMRCFKKKSCQLVFILILHRH